VIRRTAIIGTLAFLVLFSRVQVEGGTIEGRVLNDTDVPPNALPSQSVTLYAYQGQEEQILQQTATDAQGRFTFQNLALNKEARSDKGVRYLVATDYVGVSYYSDWVILTPITPTVSLDLLVYEKTDEDSEIVVQPAHLLVTFSGGKILVQEILFVENKGKRTYVGRQDPALDNRVATLRFSLPKEATELSFADPNTENSVWRTPEGFVDTRPMSPGRWPYVYSYSLNYTGTAYELRKEIIYPTQGLNLLVADVGVQVESGQLSPQGRRETQAGAYQHWAKDSLTRGTGLTVTLRQLPGGEQPVGRRLAGGATAAPASPLHWVVLGLLTLAVLSALAYPFLPRREAHYTKGAE